MTTNYGEDYNRESMYETAREYFLEGKTIKVNGKKCSAMADVYLEDFRLEVEKASRLFQKSEMTLNSKKEEFLNEPSQIETTAYLQKKLENAIKTLKKCKEENIRIVKLLKPIKKLEKCSVEQLKDILIELKKYRESIIEKRVYGDGVTTISSKLLNKTNNAIIEVEQTIKEKLKTEKQIER